MLPRHARCVLSRLRCNGHSLLLGSYLSSESFLQRLWTLVPGPLSSHSALSRYGLFAPLTLWRLSVSLRPLVQTLGSCTASGAPWSSAMSPSLGSGRVNNNNNSFSTSFHPTHFSFHFALSSYGFWVAWYFLSSLRPLVQVLKCCPTSGPSRFFTMTFSSERVD